jgi:hypothetical protein
MASQMSRSSLERVSGQVIAGSSNLSQVVRHSSTSRQGTRPNGGANSSASKVENAPKAMLSPMIIIDILTQQRRVELFCYRAREPATSSLNPKRKVGVAKGRIENAVLDLRDL